jgi:hypothetical protein
LEVEVIPAIAAVPPVLPLGRYKLPLLGNTDPSVACTWTPLMVSVSLLAVPLTVIVIVRVDELTETLALAISRWLALPLGVAVTGAAVLNLHPLGAANTRVTPVPPAKSLVVPSAMTMLPKVVKLPELAFCALSAERLVPPVPGLTVTPVTLIEGLVLGPLVPSETSLAVSVAVPAVFNVTLRFLLPLTNPVSVGMLANESLDLRSTVSPTLLTTFQLASTAFTVTAKAVPPL